MKKIILFITLFLPVLLYSQNNMEIIWQSCFGGSQNEWVNDIIQTENGYLLFGKSNSIDGDVSGNHGNTDIWILSIDSIGNKLWERCYGGSGPEIPNDIIKTNGVYYFGGWTGSDDGDIQSGNHGGYDRWIVKIDSQGEIIWEKCYGGSGTEYGGSLILLDNGNILTYAASSSNDGDVPINYGSLDVWLMIMTPDGEILQSEVFGNIGNNNVFDIVETRDGGFFMASKVIMTGGMVEGDFHGETDVWAVKLNADLEIEWQKLYGGSWTDYGYNGILELDNGYLFLASTTSNDFDVSGYHGTPGPYTPDIWAVRIDTIGNIIWQKCLGGYESDWSGTLHQTDDGGFVIFGETQSDDGDVSGNNSYNTYSDIWMVKLDSEGEILWQQCYGGRGSERLYKGVIQKSDDNWIVAGRTNLMSENSSYVNCDLHGRDDYWIFEIKDCSQYPTEIPQMPSGADTLCSNVETNAVYSIPSAAGASSYQWYLSPENAGTINGDSLLGTVNWSSDFEGTASIVARSANDCGESQWSQPHYTQVYTCLGTEELEAINLKVYPNPATSHVIFELSVIARSTATKQSPKILITNAYGQYIAQLEVSGGKTVWDTKTIKSGIYFYSIEIDRKKSSGKIVILK